MSAKIDVVKRLFDAVEDRDLETMLACYAPTVEIHETSALPYGGVYRGHVGATEHAIAFMAAWGRHQGPEEALLGPTFAETEDGKVLVCFRHKAVDRATGARIDEPEISLYEVSEGQVVRSRMFHFDPNRLSSFLDASPTDAQT